MTIGDLIRNESARFNHFCYCSVPYTCGIDEALSSMIAKQEIDERVYIHYSREPKETIISLKKSPKHKRKFCIKLWIDW